LDFCSIDHSKEHVVAVWLITPVKATTLAMMLGNA
jgi:hypothetical protein